MGTSQEPERRRTARASATALLVLLALVVGNPAADAAGPVLPSEDAFYTYEGSEPLRAIPAGTVLKHRTVQMSFGPGNSTPIEAEQLLYRTTGQRGEPTVTVTTVLRPMTTPASPTIVEYLSFYDGL